MLMQQYLRERTVFIEKRARRRRTFSTLQRFIDMDAKDLLIKQLQAKLEDQQAELVEAKVQQQATVEQFAQALDQKNQVIALLEQKIKRLLSTVRGSRQERINPDQLLLFSAEELQQLALELESPEPSIPEPTPEELATIASPKKKPSHGRRKLPDHLKQEVIRYELTEQERKCPCCGNLRTECGSEESAQLEVIPMTLKVIKHQRVKYACKTCQENVVIALKPPQPIEKGIAAPGLCAYTVLSKFGDHQPLYREEELFSRIGWPIRRSTICEWLFQLASLAEPLVMRMKHLLLQSKVIHTDDTKIKMIEARICREAKFWPYQGDWLHPYVVFDFTLDRSRHGPQKFLERYEGYLQADAFSGYDCVYAPGRVREVACWVHTRRYWHDCLDHDPVRANMALGFIARLSQIESQLRQSYPEKTMQGERDFDRIAEARQKLSRPILESFKQWLDEELATGRVLPKSELRKAFTYTLNQWNALCRYTEAGYLSMENNAAERLVKYPAIGRKNYLFVGNERAGRNAAIFYSLVTSAKRNGVEPFAWLKAIFTRLPQLRHSEAVRQSEAQEPVTSEELDELLPDRWLQSHPDCKWTIDEVRRKERQRKELTKRLQRKRR